MSAFSINTAPRIGRLACGPRDAISDVAGVRVGHVTLTDAQDPALQTGVTVIRPHTHDCFRHKTPAGVAIINGFGKSVGLMQLSELGQLETPIALTNTFAVGTVAQAQIRACVADNPETGRSLPTVNPLVLECNDGFLNDAQRMAVREDHYHAALAVAGADFAQGAVGAGRGMSSFQFKGGIGSASRRVRLPGNDGLTYTVGALVLANYGLLPNLIWAGQQVGERLASQLDAQAQREAWATERGSIIMVLATDAPLCSRQLGRLALRAAAGLARTGSVYGHGSGDIALAFSTAYTLPAAPDVAMPRIALVHEARLDPLFQAAADSVEQAIVHALWYAETVLGRDGHVRRGLRTLISSL